MYKKTKEHSKRELDILLKEPSFLEIPGFGKALNNEKTIAYVFYKEIISMCEKIDNRYDLYDYNDNPALGGVISKVLRNMPLSPITKKETEEENWINNVHIRCKDLIRKDNVAIYTGAIYWRNSDGGLISAGVTVHGIDWLQPVKFPFTPKTFIIDIERVQPAKYEYLESKIKYDLGYKIKDKSQLKQVAEYYDVDQDFIDLMEKE